MAPSDAGAGSSPQGSLDLSIENAVANVISDAITHGLCR
jgi:hypothetical protein